MSCAAAPDRFPLVAGTKVHRDRLQTGPFCYFLGLFAPIHAQEAQIRSTAHRELPAALLLLEQYHNRDIRVILMLLRLSDRNLKKVDRDPQIR
jgi:hypothetical protein